MYTSHSVLSGRGSDIFSWAACVPPLLVGLSLGVTLLRVLINVGLLVIGGFALFLTLDSMFQGTVGLIELSFMELMFLALYLAAAIRIRHRLVLHGGSVAASVLALLTLLRSAGWCALGISLLLVVVFVIEQFDSSPSSATYRADDLSGETWLQAAWLGALLISAYLAAPRLEVAAPSQSVQEADRPFSEEPRT